MTDSNTSYSDHSQAKNSQNQGSQQSDVSGSSQREFSVSVSQMSSGQSREETIKSMCSLPTDPAPSSRTESDEPGSHLGNLGVDESRSGGELGENLGEFTARAPQSN